MVANSLKEENQEEIAIETTEKTRLKKKRRYRIRKFPIWLRMIVVLAFFAVALAVGLMVGYGVIGDGNAADVFQKSTWQHIGDIVNKEK